MKLSVAKDIHIDVWVPDKIKILQKKSYSIGSRLASKPRALSNCIKEPVYMPTHTPIQFTQV